MCNVIRSMTILFLAAAVASICGPQATGQEDLTALEEQAMQAAVQRVAPSLVQIETLGGVEQIQGKLLGSGPTTGLIVSADGFILSSAFGFVGKPSSILVTLPSGKRTSAKIVARDSNRMLVLLKATTNEMLSVPPILPRESLQVGQWTLAVGRTYPGKFPNMSVGILSARNRIWGKAVQTDAKVSPSNYGGPLIDIRGNVIGILVPLSPQQQGEMAGSEWYDSGIGFAVPLSDIMRQLDTMKQGNDLKPGILGVSLKGTDLYGVPAVIAACPAKSPAREAGLEVGDTIVEVDGKAIQRQAQLRHALGPHVAGDSIHVVVQRGKEKKRIEATIELVAELEPYVRPELGILPMRLGNATGQEAGVTIRYLIPNGPAATAGLQGGDRITGLNDLKIADTDALREAVIGFDPGAEVTVRFNRKGASKKLTIKLARQSTTVPDILPTAHPDLKAGEGGLPAVGMIDIQIPEAANKCLAYVPENYNPTTQYALVVWLAAPGSFDKDALQKRWKPICDQNNVILLAPQPANPRRWTSLEIEFIRKTMDDVVSHYAIDPARVVVHGYLAGAAMAYHVAFGNRELCRAVAPVGAPLPMRIGVPMTDPVLPMSIYSCSSPSSKAAEQIEAGQKQLTKRAFPVIVVKIPDPERYLNAKELAEMFRWIDTLDRI